MVLAKLHGKVLEEMFPKKLKRVVSSKAIYDQLKEMILTGKLKKRE